jgi:phosphomannomutase
MKVSISGVRGIYGIDFTLSDVRKFVTLFTSSMVKVGGKCVIGRDTRPSSKIIAGIVSAVLTKQGIDVFDLGVAPTPMVFRECRKYESGCIITASHNPLDWNGLKFVIGGRGIFENELSSMLTTHPQAPDSHKFGSYFITSSNYIQEVAELTKDLARGTKTKLGLDLGGGATCGYANSLFKKLGNKFTSINDVREISVRDPDPTIDELRELRILVRSNLLDLGFAFDLDGDRLVIVDKNGNKLNSDSTLLMCVASAIKLGINSFVISVDTSVSVSRLIEEYHGTWSYSRVGEANVINKMLDLGAGAGGEGSSAGFVMPKFNMCRDGFLASALISSLDKKSIDECMSYSSQYLQIRSKIPVGYAPQTDLLNRLYEKLKQESSEVLEIDGIKIIIDEESWVLMRPSNTEHAIRVSVESRADEAISLYERMSEKVRLVYEQLK